MKTYRREMKLKDRLTEQAQRGIDRIVAIHARARRNEAAWMTADWACAIANLVVDALAERFTFREKQRRAKR